MPACKTRNVASWRRWREAGPSSVLVTMRTLGTVNPGPAWSAARRGEDTVEFRLWLNFKPPRPRLSQYRRRQFGRGELPSPSWDAPPCLASESGEFPPHRSVLRPSLIASRAEWSRGSNRNLSNGTILPQRPNCRVPTILTRKATPLFRARRLESSRCVPQWPTLATVLAIANKSANEKRHSLNHAY